MVSSSRRRRALTGPPALLVVALCALPGCFTGHLLSASRIDESVVRYSGAYSDGTDLWLAYEVELAGPGAERSGPEPRAAVVALRDLRARPEIPVDEFPVRSAGRGETIGDGLEVVPIRTEHAGDSQMGESPDASGAPLAVVVRVRNGTAERFELRGSGTGADGEPLGRFHSDALIRRHDAWWVYPALPFGLAVDLVVTPIHAVVMSLFVLFGI